MVIFYMSLQPIGYYLFLDLRNETQVGYRPVNFQFICRKRCFFKLWSYMSFFVVLRNCTSFH